MEGWPYDATSWEGMREKEGIVSIATKKICTANVSRMEINKRQLLKMGILRVQSKNTNIWFDLFDSHGWKWIGSFSQIDNRNLAIIHSRQSLCSKVLVVRGFSIVFTLSLPLRRDSGQGASLQVYLTLCNNCCIMLLLQKTQGEWMNVKNEHC